jgi:hypothetical protein
MDISEGPVTFIYWVGDDTETRFHQNVVHFLLQGVMYKDDRLNDSYRTGTSNLSELLKIIMLSMGTAVAQWLRYCATNRKVAGSIPDGVIGIFH